MTFLIIASLLATAAASAISGSDSRALHVDKSTLFNMVIGTDDVDTREPIYMTPAVVMIGKRNGELLRCLQEDPNNCELFQNLDGFVCSMVVTGEYLYVGLDGGKIFRCELNTKKSCKILHKNSHDVNSLVVTGGYLYAGLNSGSILRCDLNLPDTCRTLRTQGIATLYSLIQSKEYIYAGHSSGDMIRYSTRADDSHTAVYNIGSMVMGFYNLGDSIYAITWDGYLWSCSHKSDAAANFCESVRNTHYNQPTAVAHFSGILYVLDSEGLHVCRGANNTSCLTYEHHKESWSMAFVFGTYQMQSTYNNEDTTCTWQSHSKCPPYVTYYDVHERDMLEVSVTGGKLYNAQGFLVDTSNADEGHNGPAAIFAMGPDGRILLSNAHKRELLHTSSLFAGSPVSGAGEMVVKDGVIVKMKACSEHYRLDANMNKQVIQSLRTQGYTLAVDSVSCGEDVSQN